MLRSLLAAGCIALLATTVQAEELVMVGHQSGMVSTGDVPATGLSMQTVETRFGEPENRTSAVGNPPISRWNYAGFSVYFEGERVIHSVIHPQQ